MNRKEEINDAFLIHHPKGYSQPEAEILEFYNQRLL